MDEDKSLTRADLDRRAQDKGLVYERFKKEEKPAELKAGGKFGQFLEEVQKEQKRLDEYEGIVHPQHEQKEEMKKMVEKGDFFSWQDLARKSAARVREKKKAARTHLDKTFTRLRPARGGI